MALEDLHLLPPDQQEEILNRAALDPPEGVDSIFENPPNENDLLLAVVSIGLVIASAAFLLRAYARAGVMRQVSVEDVLLFIGYGFLVAFAYCCYRIVGGTGAFVHQWNYRLRDMFELLYVLNLASTFYSVAMGCLKVAILLEWIRIFSPRNSRGWFWYASWALLIVNGLLYTSALIAGNVSCIPHRKIWDRTVPGKCFSRTALDTAMASINVVSSVFILILPQKVIWSLQMNTAKKIGVSSVFAIGLFAVIAAVCRLAATVTYVESPDFTYNVAGMTLWCFAEQTCAVLVLCIPMVPKAFHESGLFRKFRSGVRSHSGPSSKGNNDNKMLEADDSLLLDTANSHHNAGIGLVEQRPREPHH